MVEHARAATMACIRPSSSLASGWLSASPDSCTRETELIRNWRVTVHGILVDVKSRFVVMFHVQHQACMNATAEEHFLARQEDRIVKRVLESKLGVSHSH